MSLGGAWDSVRSAQGSDQFSAEQLYVFLRERLLPLLKVRLPRRIDPEDVLDETYIGAWQGLPSVRDQDKLLGFSWRIAWRIVGRILRRESQRGEGQLPGYIAYTDPLPESLEADEVWATGLEGLRLVDLRLFRALYVRRLPPGEAEKEMAISHGNFLVLKHRLDEKIRALMKSTWSDLL